MLRRWLADFEERQSKCVQGTTGDDKFVLVKKDEADGGLGNQLPIHVTGKMATVSEVQSAPPIIERPDSNEHLSKSSHWQYAYGTSYMHLNLLDVCLQILRCTFA